MACPTYQEVIDSKSLNQESLIKDIDNLRKWKPTLEKGCFAGNALLYHYQLNNLCNVKVNGISFKEMMEDDVKREKMWFNANKYAKGSRENNLPLRLFEMWRRMNGAIVFFKPSVAKYIYKELGATHVLDPTAGWGGRLLGAWSLGISYTGFDTNEQLIPAYEKIAECLENYAEIRNTHQEQIEMNFSDCMKADFREIDYDCVLTSPPYLNIELYPGMTPFDSKKHYYQDWLIPLITKCRENIKRNGWTCINIDPKMYKALTEEFNYPKADREYYMPQQKIRNTDKANKVYCWSALEI